MHHIILLNNVRRKLGNTRDIVVSLCGESRHEVKLYHALSSLKGNADGSHEILLANIFIYNVAKSLRSRLGRKGQGRRAYSCYLIHEFLCKAIHSQGRKRNAYHVIVRPLKERIGKLFKLCIIAYRK